MPRYKNCDLIKIFLSLCKLITELWVTYCDIVRIELSFRHYFASDVVIKDVVIAAGFLLLNHIIVFCTL